MQLIIQQYIHKSTGFSPNLLFLGREIYTPLDILFRYPHQNDNESYTKYISALRDKLVKANHFCRSQLNKNQVKQSHYYNKTMHEISLEVGSLVWLFTPARKKGLSPKLSSAWSGPYEIVKKLSDITFRIKPVNGRKLSVVHVNRLKPVKPRTFCSSELPDRFQEPMVSKDVETHTDISEALLESPDNLPKEDESTEEQEYEESKESERETTHHSETQKILRRSKRKVQLPYYLNDYKIDVDCIDM